MYVSGFQHTLKVIWYIYSVQINEDFTENWLFWHLFCKIRCFFPQQNVKIEHNHCCGIGQFSPFTWVDTFIIEIIKTRLNIWTRQKT